MQYDWPVADIHRQRLKAWLDIRVLEMNAKYDCGFETEDLKESERYKDMDVLQDGTSTAEIRTRRNCPSSTRFARLSHQDSKKRLTRPKSP